MRRRSTARAASCSAWRRRWVSNASKSSWSAAPGATSWAISASIAGANSGSQAFFYGAAAVPQPRLAQVVADVDQFRDETAQALALRDLGLGGLHFRGRDRAAARLAPQRPSQQPVRPVAGVLRGGAAAAGLAALAVVLHEGAGPQIADGGELLPQLVAAGGQGGEVERDGQGGPPFLLAYHTYRNRPQGHAAGGRPAAGAGRRTPAADGRGGPSPDAGSQPPPRGPQPGRRAGRERARTGAWQTRAHRGSRTPGQVPPRRLRRLQAPVPAASSAPGGGLDPDDEALA